MSRIRQPAVAGNFYPAEAAELQAWLAELPPSEPLEFYPPRMLLLPHAGYYYSGKLAALGVNQLATHHYRRVILLCPAHRVALRGVALPAADCEAFTTLLGEIKLERETLVKLAQQADVHCSELAHRDEHAIEVQLPLLQHRLGEFQLIPLVVGECSDKWLCNLLRPLVNDQTLLVISSDLSHYLSYQEARYRDSMTLGQIMALEPELQPEQACGSYAINGALRLAQKFGWRPRLLGQHNSGDVSGEKLQVVGYAALAFYG